MAERFLHLEANTYKSTYLDIKAQRIVFIAYHIMGLRNGDEVPHLDSFNAVGQEHGILNMTLEDLIRYERWLNKEIPL